VRDRSLCDLPQWARRRRGVVPMPLDLRMLSTVVRVHSSGDLLGTGSLISVASEGVRGKNWPYVVTAHHVIENQTSIALDVPDPLEPGGVFGPIPCEGWEQPLPGIDLAIAPFPEYLVPRYQMTPLSQFLPLGEMPPLGGELFYLGVFSRPEVAMARSGTIGALSVPIEKPGYSYTADLVDCRSYAGFSGSPCFSVQGFAVEDDEPQDLDGPLPEHRDGRPMKLNRLVHMSSYCGMFTAHFTDEGSGQGIASRYGVGVMLPCDYVREALMRESARQDRRKADEELKARQAAQAPPLEDAAAEPPTEFDRFEKLTRQLVNTPKPARD
jgi:hypothetical protein